MFRNARARLTILLLATMILLYAITASIIYVLMVQLTTRDENSLLASSAKPLAAQVKSALDVGQFPQEFVNLRQLESLFPRLSTIVLRDPLGHILTDTDTRIAKELPNDPKQDRETVYLSPSHTWERLFSIPLRNKYHQPEGELQLALNISPDMSSLHRLRRVVLEVGGIASLLAIMAGFFASNQALQPIVRSWRRQQQFVADASHEIRSPLTIIQANLDVVLGHSNESVLDNLEWLSNARTEVTRLGKLTDNLLTLARIDSNQTMLNLQEVNLEQITSDVCHAFELLCQANNMTITLESHTKHADTGEFLLQGDEHRLRQLLVILVDNAIKYTPSGGSIRILLKKMRHQIRLDVVDSGIGIRGDELTLIFNRFYRSDAARERSQGGTGLGLAIAAWIVAMHRGKLTVESQLGQGSTFTAVFPVNKA